MKPILQFFILFVCFQSYAQTFGAYYEKGILTSGSEDLPMEKWFWTGDKEFTMLFPVTPVGFKHLREKVDKILELNGMQDADPIWDKSYINPKYEEEEDYAIIHTLLQQGEGEVHLAYKKQQCEFIIMVGSGQYKLILKQL
jgi:hypothetical protein